MRDVHYQDVPLAVSDVNSKQVYIHDEQGILVPAWEFNIKMRINRFKVHVSIYGQKLLSVIDWACAASYKAVPVGIANIQVEGLKTLINPHLAKVSQSGWHNVNGTHMESTEGNNAAAMIRYDNDNAMFPMSATNDYDFPYYPNVAPHRNAGAAIANAYYVANRMHDIFARYGFHEGAGNYQEKNFDNEGFGGDSIEIYVQAKDAFNNAFFVPSPDGQKGIMQLGLLLDENNNVYDSAFDNDIIIHELTHGLSQRLMGGPRTVDCLNNRESRAMGEGWSDFVAIWARLKETDTDHTVYKIATYVNPNGDRRVPYTLKERGSLSTYKLFNDKGWKDQHDTGVIWGNILYQMHRNIYNTMKKFSNDIANPSIDASNTLVMELIVAAMQVSPCNPTFANGRDALVMADEILTKGKYKCEIYAAFARRGVGVKARRTAIFGKVEEDFSIPNVCKGYSHLLNDPVVF
ncbi:Fungalysin metallopeptidase-domain-containing protein [Syncephalis plumigaleata]|nr:Fungalysin metallopeptidase-domain-containing protein [Syncephalis plumigaleata]